MKNIGSVQLLEADSMALAAPASLGDQDGRTKARLVPDEPPGRCTRKALSFADEIQRLYAQGYTLDAIRRALLAAGVTVSRSTVHREVTRALRQQPSRTSSTVTAPRESNIMRQVPQAGATELVISTQAVAPAVPLPLSDKPRQCNFADGASGEDVAKAFMATQITNPFVRKKDQS